MGKENSPRTRQSLPTLAAFRPWGVRLDTAARGVRRTLYPAGGRADGPATAAACAQRRTALALPGRERADQAAGHRPRAPGAQHEHVALDPRVADPAPREPGGTAGAHDVEPLGRVGPRDRVRPDHPQEPPGGPRRGGQQDPAEVQGQDAVQRRQPLLSPDGGDDAGDGEQAETHGDHRRGQTLSDHLRPLGRQVAADDERALGRLGDRLAGRLLVHGVPHGVRQWCGHDGRLPGGGFA